LIKEENDIFRIGEKLLPGNIKSCKLVFYCFLFFLLYFSNTTSATYVGLDSTIDDKLITSSNTSLSINIKNICSETLYDIDIIPLENEHFTSNKTMKVADLKLNETQVFNLSFEPKDNTKHGKYPLILRIKFYDGRNTHYSQIYHHIITFEEGFDSNLEGRIITEELKVDGSSKIKLIIDNYDNRLHNANIHFFHSDKLTIPQTNKIVSIESLSKETIQFDIRDNSSNQGDILYVLGIIEYEYDNYHYSSVAESYIRITENKNPILLEFLIVIFIILLIIYIYQKFEGNN